MVFENVTNVVFTITCNPNLNPTELLNEACKFCGILFYQYMFVMFSNIRRLNCIISGKITLDLTKMSQGHVRYCEWQNQILLPTSLRKWKSRTTVKLEAPTVLR